MEPPGTVITHLLLQSHDLESLEVGEIPPLVLGLCLLGPAGLGPLLIDLGLGPQLLDGTGTGGAGETVDGEGSEGDGGKSDGVTGNNRALLAGRTVDQSLYSEDQISPPRLAFRIHALILRNPGFSIVVTYASVVDDLDDSGELASVRTAADEDDTADLNELP